MGNKLNYSFMAFASGKVSTEVAEVKRYIGVAPVYVKAVNPTKKQLEAIYNTTIENEPSYLSEDENKVKQARIDFVVVTDAEKCGIEMTTEVTFFIKNDVRYNRDKTKIQVINKYGETTWYDWCVENWGTKWNACEVQVSDYTIEFSTAWAFAEPVMRKLAELCAKHSVDFEGEWADEDPS